MKFDEHPTWRMLERAKQEFREALSHNDAPWDPLYIAVEDAHSAIVRLQLAVEDRLLQEES